MMSPLRVICCGEVIEGFSDDEFVANVERHLRSAHPEIAGSLSRTEIIRLAKAEPKGA